MPREEQLGSDAAATAVSNPQSSHAAMCPDVSAQFTETFLGDHLSLKYICPVN